MIIEFLQLWGCQRLSKNFLSGYLLFGKKMYVVLWKGAHDAVNKNFTFLEVSICPKNVRLV